LPTLNPNLPPPIGVVPPLHLGPQMPIPQTAFWAGNQFFCYFSKLLRSILL
jgi:hypothetical protein